MPFSFVHSTKSFAWRNSYTACRRPCLWGRGGSQQLQHMVGRGTSLGRLETNQSLELVGELPLFYPFGEQQGPDLTFSKQPQESKIYVIKWIFFFPCLDWKASQQAGCCWLVWTASASTLLSLSSPGVSQWQVGTVRNRLSSHQKKVPFTSEPRDLWCRPALWLQCVSPSLPHPLASTPVISGINNLKANTQQLHKDQDNLGPGAWTRIPPSWTLCIWENSKVETRFIWCLPAGNQYRNCVRLVPP